jgi:NADH-quinone oxidoreductase subunit I
MKMAEKRGWASLFADAVLNLLKGLWVTAAYWRRPRVTVQYPFRERLAVFPRYRGRMVHLRDTETGRLRCTACQACVKACPANVITVVGDEGKGKERRAKSYEWNQPRCLFCNLCVEACPFDAIILGTSTDSPAYSREELVWQLDRLLEPELVVGAEKKE